MNPRSKNKKSSNGTIVEPRTGRTIAARPSRNGAATKARNVKQYEHTDEDTKRLNNPPVGLVTLDNDPILQPKTFAYDPHLDPQLVWAGKAEKSEVVVDTVSLHVHERIDPHTIMEAVRTNKSYIEQPSLFAQPSENPPLREALGFYTHKHGWSNRLIAGDSLLVMNSLLERERMAGQVQMIYMDPPYGIKYGSNFQPFTNKRNVTDGNDEDLTQEPEMIRAFRDTWEYGIHSYLAYLRDRAILARDLLHDKGSIFVQIGDENSHLVRNILDEVFGSKNFIAQINFKSMSPLGQSGLARVYDYIIWYARNKENMKFHPLFTYRDISDNREFRFVDDVRSPQGFRKLSEEEFSVLKDKTSVFRRSKLTSSGFTPSCTFAFNLHGVPCRPYGRKSWRTNEDGMGRLIRENRLFLLSDNPYFKQYQRDFPYSQLENSWTDQPAATTRNYVVETATKFVKRCMLMATEPGDLVFDPTCGSGTTAVVAEQWGRRWITCDTSRVALTLAKQRLMTSSFDYYELTNEDDGVDGGFVYDSVQHITLESITKSESGQPQTLYDQPLVNRDKVRVTGPFTVEAVPAPMVVETNDSRKSATTADASIVRSGQTQHHSDWRAELLKTGARSFGGTKIMFSWVEPLAGTRYLHAEAETTGEKPRRVVISFGPDYQPLERRQVEAAWSEARMLDPTPNILLFAAFQFDPEAAKDIDEMPSIVTKKMTFLKAQMDTDLLTSDLKKNRASNQSFWLVGRPDVEIILIARGDNKGKFQVSVHGFDYYDVKTGQIESGDAKRIAMWMLDPDYGGRSVSPRQVFFPNAGDNDGWKRLAKTLRAELNVELLKAYLGTDSLPFVAGEHRRIAVKIIDNRGIESLRVLDIP